MVNVSAEPQSLVLLHHNDVRLYHLQAKQAGDWFKLESLTSRY